MNESDESFNFLCNKPLLLNKIKFAKVNPASIRSLFEGSTGSKIVIELFQKTVSDGKIVKKSLCNQNFHISAEQETFVEFSKPILIHPKRSYEIGLRCHSGIYDTIKLKFKKIVYDDLEINFSNFIVGRSSFGLVSAMCFNQL